VAYAIENVPAFYKPQKFIDAITKYPQMVGTLSQTKPVYIRTSYLKISFDIIKHLCLDLESDIYLLGYCTER